MTRLLLGTRDLNHKLSQQPKGLYALYDTTTSMFISSFPTFQVGSNNMQATSCVKAVCETVWWMSGELKLYDVNTKERIATKSNHPSLMFWHWRKTLNFLTLKYKTAAYDVGSTVLFHSVSWFGGQKNLKTFVLNFQTLSEIVCYGQLCSKLVLVDMSHSVIFIQDSPKSNSVRVS